MSQKSLKYKHREVRLRKPHTDPEFLSKTVLVENPWDYVDLWLKREDHSDARFYWEQAKGFFEAAEVLPTASAPLPAYYCLLNGVKALLSVKGHSYQARHGVSGDTVKEKRSLRGETVTFQAQGVLPTLSSHLGESTSKEEHNLYTLLYNLPWIHRAFVLTYTSAPELFIPIKNPRFVTESGSSNAWFCADVEDKWASGHTTKKLPQDYERDDDVGDRYVVRKRSTFTWEYGAANEDDNVARLQDYHQEIRTQVFYIDGPSRAWYLKRNDQVDGVIERSSMTLTFAAMHRLSEMSRYDPLLLARHLDRHHNWLLTEFVNVALRQLIDELAAEITGRDFMLPGITT